MRIVTEILGVKGLKAHNNWSQQRLYTEWLQISMVSIFIWDDLTSYWLGISKTKIFNEHKLSYPSINKSINAHDVSSTPTK